MKILVAPNAMKGSLNAFDLADAIHEGLSKAGLSSIEKLPVADGGDGTAKVFAPQKVGEKSIFTLWRFLQSTGKDVSKIESGGLAVGIGAAFNAMFGTELVDGASCILISTFLIKLKLLISLLQAK